MFQFTLSVIILLLCFIFVFEIGLIESSCFTVLWAIRLIEYMCFSVFWASAWKPGGATLSLGLEFAIFEARSRNAFYPYKNAFSQLATGQIGIWAFNEPPLQDYTQTK